MAEQPQQTSESQPWWFVRLGRAIVSMLSETAVENLEEAIEDESFSEQVAQEPVATCTGTETPAEESIPEKKRKKRKKKKKKPAAPTNTELGVEEEEEKLDEVEERPPVQTQQPPPRPKDDSGWASATKVRKRRETRWYDNLPQVSSSGKSDACDSIASGLGEHTTDHLPELIDAVGEGPFDRGILARIIAQAFLKNEVVAVNALISRHYLLTEIPHALLEGGTKQLVSPIIVVYNTLVDPRRKSFGTCYSITWQRANRYRAASTV